MNKIDVILMASGNAKRFGENKLLYLLDGMPLIEHTLKYISKANINKLIVVTKYQEIKDICQNYNCVVVDNIDTTGDPSITIKLGMKQVNDASGVMLLVGDEPYLKTTTINEMIECFNNQENKIVPIAYLGERGNPVIFPKSLFNELIDLLPFEKGSTIIKKHQNMLSLFNISNQKELQDIDFIEDLK